MCDTVNLGEWLKKLSEHCSHPISNDMNLIFQTKEVKQVFCYPTISVTCQL